MTYDYQKFTKTKHEIIKTHQILVKNQDIIVLHRYQVKKVKQNIISLII